MPATVSAMPEEELTLDPYADCSALLAALPGCDAVAHVDLSARTVLRAETARRLPQERLDALCNWAATALATGGEIALALDDTSFRVARRIVDPATGTPGSEGLCLVLPPITDPSLVLALLSTGPRE
jgi:hypothetical protein